MQHTECEDYIYCPICSTPLDTDDVVYVSEERIITGCQKCIHEEYGWQFCKNSGEVE